ncbi:MAG: hypothetical protein ACI8QH_000190 [Flammeovirgaceae bacterium]|jgi:hypothetical protein
MIMPAFFFADSGKSLHLENSKCAKQREEFETKHYTSYL